MNTNTNINTQKNMNINTNININMNINTKQKMNTYMYISIYICITDHLPPNSNPTPARLETRPAFCQCRSAGTAGGAAARTAMDWRSRGAHRDRAGGAPKAPVDLISGGGKHKHTDERDLKECRLVY